MEKQTKASTLTTFDKCKKILSLGFEINLATEAEIKSNAKFHHHHLKGEYYVCRGFIFDFTFGKYEGISKFVEAIYPTVMKRELTVETKVTDEEVTKLLQM